MTALEDAWDGLDRFKKGGYPSGYPENVKRLYSPIDKVHEGLLACIGGTHLSLAFAMFGYDDDELNHAVLYDKLKDERIPVQGSLDSTQAKGPHEVPLIREWSHLLGNSLSVGHSTKGAITHLKTFVLDGILTVGGSTNLSHGGQFDQDNEMLFVWDAVFAAETRARLDKVHDAQLEQMAKRQNKLVVDYAEKKSKLTKDEARLLLAGVVPPE
jgi:phosphatidylserine/phosphatidylglycerophosphate/cardiolipin synthase-like enzyme